jgi:hypothetical protein
MVTSGEHAQGQLGEGVQGRSVSLFPAVPKRRRIPVRASPLRIPAYLDNRRQPKLLRDLTFWLQVPMDMLVSL